MKELLKFFLSEKGKLFVRGAIVGGYSGFVFLFNATLDWNNIAWLWAVKFVGVIIIAFTSAIMTVLGTDFYKLKLKDKFFKPTNNEQPKDEQPEDDEKVA